jgi:hypothetical protein
MSQIDLSTRSGARAGGRFLSGAWSALLALAAILAAILAAVPAVFADIVELHDGRRFEGNVLSQDGEKVRIDAKVGGIRVSLGFSRAEVKRVIETELPADFFDAPAAEKRVSDPKKFSSGQTLYLEVPIIGVLGQSVFAEGISSALAYAVRHGIQHVVFVIDSAGGDVDETREIYKTLKRFQEPLTFHGIFRKCQGEALAVGVWCDTVHLPPGGRLGGPFGSASAPASKDDAEEREIVWAQIAFKVVKETGRSGRPAEFVRALIDPSERLAGWKDENGVVQTGIEPPEGTPKERIIFQDGEGQVLELTQEQAVALGMPAFRGGAPELGEALKLKSWTAESDYGLKAMERTAAQRQQRAKAAVAAFEEKVKRNVSRREAASLQIENSLKEAAGWDPTKGSYETYSQYWNWGWGWSGSSSASQWTAESQRRWKTRTDACMFYLQSAGKALVVMKRLDAEAVKLGLEPSFKSGEVDEWLKDIQVKLVALQKHRGRTGD